MSQTGRLTGRLSQADACCPLRGRSFIRGSQAVAGQGGITGETIHQIVSTNLRIILIQEFMQVMFQNPGRALTQSSTNTKRDVIGPGKYPEIAQEIAKEFDLDYIFSLGKYSISISHHQIFHGKPIAQFFSDKAVDPIGANQEINRVIELFCLKLPM